MRFAYDDFTWMLLRKVGYKDEKIITILHYRMVEIKNVFGNQSTIFISIISYHVTFYLQVEAPVHKTTKTSTTKRRV